MTKDSAADFVSPFALFEDRGGHVRVVCQLTQAETRMPPSHVDSLARWFEGRPSTLPEADRAKYRANNLLFESEETFWSALGTTMAAKIRPFPLIYEIELTNHCPYRCIMCPRTSSMTRSLGHMDPALYRRIIDQIAPHQHFVTLHHFGESLLYPHLGEAISYARAKGVLADLSVNPPSLTPAKSDLILDAGLATLTLSLDAVDPTTYQAIRGVSADFRKIEKNIGYLLSQRQRQGSPLIVTLQMINLCRNQTEQAAFVEKWRGRGLDAVIVRQFSSRDYSTEKAQSLSGEKFGVRRPCKAPWRQLSILWDGRVVPCSLDYDANVPLGDASIDTLADVWAGPRQRRLRSAWTSHALCNRCSRSPQHMMETRRKLGFRAYHFSNANYKIHRAYVRHDYHDRLRAVGHF